MICHDESRWGCAIDSEENTYCRVHFRRHGVEVVLVKTPIDPQHEYAPMLKSFESIQASQFSKKLSELTLRGAENNGRYSNGGSAPYGFKRVAINLKTGAERDLGVGDRIIKGQEKVVFAVGDPSEVQIVERIFQRRIQGFSYSTIAKGLNRDRIICPKRGRWRNRDQKWSGATVKGILGNPVYMGVRVYNRISNSRIQARQKSKDVKAGINYPHWKNDRSEWIVYPDAHAPIVTAKVWEEANSINLGKGMAKKSGHSYSSRFLLTGKVYCSLCGFAFQGCSTTSKGRDYSRYEDGGWKAKAVCDYIGISKQRLETFAFQCVLETLSSPDFRIRVERMLQSSIRRISNTMSEEGERLKKLLDEKTVMARNLADELAMGNRSEAVRTRLGELEREKSAIERKLETVTRTEKMQGQANDLLVAVQSFARDFKQIFEKSPIEYQKRLMQMCVSRILVDRQKNLVTVYVWQVPPGVAGSAGIGRNKNGSCKSCNCRK